MVLFKLIYVIFPVEIMYNFKKSAEKYNYEPVKLWVGPFLFVGVYKPEDVQVSYVIFFYVIQFYVWTRV